MGGDPANHHRPGLVGDNHFHPVSIALHVKNDHVVCQKTRRCIGILDVLRLFPRSQSGVGNPVVDPGFGIRVLASEFIELVSPHYLHRRSAYLSRRHATTIVPIYGNFILFPMLGSRSWC